MITSALIKQCRREFQDQPKSTQKSRQGNGTVNLFNVGSFPVMENSYNVYLSGVTKVENTDFTFDLDNGDLRMIATPANGVEVKAQFKYAEWRDQHWNEAINDVIEGLNSRGFFRQVVRDPVYLSAGVTSVPGPTNGVDVYELLVAGGNGSISGNYVKPRVNWSYQQDANKIVLGNRPSVGQNAKWSYLRNLRTYAATSATLDVLDDWVPIIQVGAGAKFYRSLAAKVAKQGNATIDEGHFSFTNLKTMANDLDKEFEMLAMRKKPTRPAKDFQFNDPNGGVA